jgi:hypothetical protein
MHTGASIPRISSPLPPSAALLRLRAAWKRPALDTALAEGVDPDASAELALRAEQLVDPRLRARLARSLRRAITSTDPPLHHRLPARGSAVPVSRAAVRAARPALLALADDLVDTTAPNPRGVALTVRLLTDGAGPLYRPWTPVSLHEATDQARAALAAV